jgi:hypothetical protein
VSLLDELRVVPASAPLPGDVESGQRQPDE